MLKNPPGGLPIAGVQPLPVGVEIGRIQKPKLYLFKGEKYTWEELTFMDLENEVIEY